MKPSSAPTRHGAALLIVLAALVITMTATTILVQAVSTLQLHKRIQSCEAIADDLLIAADSPIQRGLIEESANAVASAEAQSPRMDVLRDQWTLDGLDYQLRITAFDQFGMVPSEAARGGSPLRLTLPSEVLRMVDAMKPPSAESTNKAVAGLDWFTNTETTGTHFCPVFPQPIHQSHAALALGELIATHNSDSGGPPRININTAPMPLVEAALRLAGRGGIEQVIVARKAGKPATIGAQKQSTAAIDSKFMPEIVSSSTCWSFRIDIHIGPLWRSWWATYRVGNSGKWECVQRLAITE